ncbi:ilvD [Symbiodinium sp. CCMP2456]|nr:ilvD [Symbiodinium sp. CCMP2456]
MALEPSSHSQLWLAAYCYSTQLLGFCKLLQLAHQAQARATEACEIASTGRNVGMPLQEDEDEEDEEDEEGEDEEEEEVVQEFAGEDSFALLRCGDRAAARFSEVPSSHAVPSVCGAVSAEGDGCARRHSAVLPEVAARLEPEPLEQSQPEPDYPKFEGGHGILSYMREAEQLKRGEIGDCSCYKENHARFWPVWWGAVSDIPSLDQVTLVVLLVMVMMMPLMKIMGLKKESFKITGDPKKPDGAPNSFVKMTCSRANFRAAGWKDDDFVKPVITIAAPYSNSMPCNNQFRDLADILAEEVEKLGGKAHFCFTPVISDGQSQGCKAMRYSLISREVITDCIELMHEGYHADAIITLAGCDKSVPASVMPLARKDLLGLSLFGGPALPGIHPGSCRKRGSDGEAVETPGKMMDPGKAHSAACAQL